MGLVIVLLIFIGPFVLFFWLTGSNHESFPERLPVQEEHYQDDDYRYEPDVDVVDGTIEY